jgi:nucleoside-diphosphate-sugar epimerase
VGHAFNIGNARPLAQCEILEALFAAASKKTEVIRVPRERIARAGGHPMGPNLYFGMYFDLPPITSVISKAQRVLGLKPTAFADGLKETFRWYSRHHEKKAIDYAFEDRLLERERARMAS